MNSLFFCNIGWMDRYEGYVGKPDQIVGGGKHIDETGSGGEVCNFLPGKDGFIYGHVETVKKDIDRQIRIESLGATGDLADHVTVVWTALHPQEGGRRVIGWYREATVFRHRQTFRKYPSLQHRRDEVGSFRIFTQASHVSRVPIEGRTIRMPKGPGWMGQVPWWTPPARPGREVKKFLAQVVALMADLDAEVEDSGIVIEKRLYRLHRQQERNPTAARRAKQHHGFRCQACEFDFQLAYGSLGEGFIEAHHLRPLASLEQGEVGVYNLAKDFAVLCANCHRMIHRTLDPSDLRSFKALIMQQRPAQQEN
jgi:hypothetical protein